MGDDFKINPNLGTNTPSLINSENFYRLSESGQKYIINAMNEAREKEGGLMGKFFGTNKDNASIHCAFVICVLMLVVGIVCMILGENYWNVIFPAVTSAIGFIFGKGNK